MNPLEDAQERQALFDALVDEFLDQQGPVADWDQASARRKARFAASQALADFGAAIKDEQDVDAFVRGETELHGPLRAALESDDQEVDRLIGLRDAEINGRYDRDVAQAKARANEVAPSPSPNVRMSVEDRMRYWDAIDNGDVQEGEPDDGVSIYE